MPDPWIAHSPPEVSERAHRWLRSAALRRLIARLDGPTNATIPELRRWSERNLNTRRGAERRDAPRVLWSADRLDATLEAAGPLGLLATPGPQLTRYDATVLLGGAATGNRLRTALAADLAARGVELGRLALVTAERPIGVREHETDPDSRQDRSEWENLLRHVTDTFGPLSSMRSEIGAGWHDQLLHSRDGLTIRVLVAPPGTANRRATTVDGIRFFLGRIDEHERARTLLAWISGGRDRPVVIGDLG
jgi:hypothetical protein